MKLHKYPNIQELEALATTMRKQVLSMLEKAKSGHPGGSLSIIEILIGLYYYKMKHNPSNPEWNERDIFILSKGHACPALYAVLANCGYFPIEELDTLRKMGSRLQGHAFYQVPGVEASTGSLGQGLSIALGFALSMQMSKSKRNVYVVLGDGELQEGQVWEAAMSAAHYKVDHLCAIIDKNTLQIDGSVRDTIGVEPLVDKWKAFGWHVIEVDGHNVLQVMKGLDRADKLYDKPIAIIAHTIKGKGVSFMEHELKWHGVAPSKKELQQAIEELED